MDKVVVAVLAGGRGTRLGGEKAMVDLGGRPLIERPLAAARAAGLDAVVVAKRGTRLPDDVTAWLEPDEPTHPLLGLVTALEHGPVVAVACDQPWLTPGLLRTLAEHEGPALAVEREPFPGRYEPQQLPVLRAALEAQASLRATLGRLQPAVLAWRRDEVASVNTRAELDAAREAGDGDGAPGRAVGSGDPATSREAGSGDAAMGCEPGSGDAATSREARP